MASAFKLVDLSSQIRQAASAWTGQSGQGEMHITFTKEGGDTKVVVVPIQGAYDPTWGPCPADLRSENYHDPVAPGTVLSDGGVDYVWQQDKGYVLFGSGQSTSAQDALAALAGAADAYSKAKAK